MTALNKIEEKYKIGQSIFEEIFKLTDKEVKEKLKEIFEYNDKISEFLNYNCDCTRIIKNGVPYLIKLSFYDHLEISWLGISWINEYGKIETLKEFDKYFKIGV